MTSSGHRITIEPADGPVRVVRDGEPVARTDRALALRETGCRVRLYLPPEDVRTDLLVPSERHTYCPFKGTASYWSLPGRPDAVWAYPDPKPEVASIAGYFCFYDEDED
ncbi:MULTISPECIES: DUF427 domain-containing protein [Streptomyces]|uniref:DUF427 domain-containing protein n=2 Tax=Streptomyces TaxID=1883 RepID=A0A1D8G6U3_9ACTN|nr:MULTISPECIES: DUF427 domain-containing protein [Streptomyces]AOT61180.1 hypothetical protein A4G23_04058 [Streptomyces rubrolavendulae]KAF0650154.1 hypothetical protein K701_10235 [Streptomyces fradiae ATCC 10745 = DSM 40063]OSY51952.1 hypothetical protein BG846_02414 [Streptomyces fradiae ATCC 10745 = DSM 40063]QEV14206.1 DUF427 domain-containing protein [Streptomyces fradiae ATCC 10745 = DSM 40063]UQS30564.1 DUF427 domain-containing protein [Streptomyces fradiae]